MFDYTYFQKSLGRLQEQNDRLKELPGKYPDWVMEAVKESTIQRFETCWDCLWKALRHYLLEESGVPEVPNGPNPVIRLANENALLPSSVEQWFQYAKARVDTAHDYSGEKAEASLAIMDGFVDDAINLYQTLSGETWK